MRWTGCLLATVVMGLAPPVFGGQPGCASCNGGAANVWVTRGLGGEACFSPCGYELVPGCCEDVRHCCDNAWAGYCDHRARVDAFWAKVGMPKAYGHGPCARPVRDAYGTSTSATPCQTTPTPAVKPLSGSPTPAPNAARELDTAPMPPTPSDTGSRSK